MKLIIDCSSLRVGGGIQVAVSFINDLKKNISNHYFTVILSPQMRNSFERESFNNFFTFIDFNENYYKNIFRRSKELKLIEQKINPDKIFAIFGPSYYKSNCTKIVGYAIPHFIYKDSPYIKALNFKNKIKLIVMQKIQIWLFNKFSDELVFETKNAEQIYVKNYKYKKNTHVVSNTLNEVFLNKHLWEPIKIKKKSKKSILCVSANYAHKNLVIIKSMIEEKLNTNNYIDFEFLITCDKNDLSFDDKYDKYINYLGKVDIKQIPSLYLFCDIVFMPSLLEVFSATYLEAMFMEKPLLVSDMPFSRDICDDSAIYFNPLDASDALEKLGILINNNSLRNDLIVRGLNRFNSFLTSMDRTKKYLKIIENSK